MTLTNALIAVFTDNARIRRPSWQNVFVTLEDGKLCIYDVPDDKLYHPWTIAEADWFAGDWEVVE